MANTILALTDFRLDVDLWGSTRLISTNNSNFGPIEVDNAKSAEIIRRRIHRREMRTALDQYIALLGKQVVSNFVRDKQDLKRLEFLSGLKKTAAVLPTLPELREYDAVNYILVSFCYVVDRCTNKTANDTFRSLQALFQHYYDTYLQEYEYITNQWLAQ